jgi:2-polyprenyl-6-methoxyphenol hydroxylase-like FAD-dependent oxidoreductase
MFRRKSPAVLVAGAGPVGLFAALCLARQGIQVDIIDEADPLEAAALEAPWGDIILLSPGSLALLERAHVATELLEDSRQVPKLELYDREQLVAEISFARWAADLKSPFSCVAVVSRTQLEAVLRAALQRHQVKVRRGWRLALMEQGTARARVLLEQLGRESTGYATLHTEVVVEKSAELEPRFVIVAECRAVPVYRQLGIELEDLGERRMYAVLDGQRAAEGPDTALLVQGERSAAALWPLRDGRLRCVVDLEDWAPPETEPNDGEPNNADDAQRIALSRLQGRLMTIVERVPALATRTSGLQPRALFSTRPRLANELGRGRIWLVGAAAHSAAPLAAQSSNGGLREASRLAELCARALTREEPPQALDDYNRETSREWEQLLGMLQPGPSAPPAQALLGRLSAGLAASRVERDALHAQLRAE